MQNSPVVAASPKPQKIKPLTIDDFSSIINTSKDAVIRVESEGCGGYIFDSTGFVVAQDLVATTAHSVAGIDYVRVRSGNTYYAAKVVYFNPVLDFAILRAAGLPIQPLQLERPNTGLAIMNADANSQVVILGYPGGREYTSTLTTVTEEYYALGWDIYSNPSIERNIFDLATKLEQGSSGSPVVNHKGNVIGIAYGIDTTNPNNAFALPTHTVFSMIEEAKTIHHFVNTEKCM